MALQESNEFVNQYVNGCNKTRNLYFQISTKISCKWQH